MRGACTFLCIHVCILWMCRLCTFLCIHVCILWMRGCVHFSVYMYVYYECVFMYISLYTCLYIMNACLCTFLCVQVCILWMSGCVHFSVYMYVYYECGVGIHFSVYMYVYYECVFMYISLYTCMYISLYTCMYTMNACLCTFLCIHVCILWMRGCVHFSVYMYVYYECVVGIHFSVYMYVYYECVVVYFSLYTCMYIMNGWLCTFLCIHVCILWMQW